MNLLHQPFVWALAAGGGMIGFGFGIWITAARAPGPVSARNSTIFAFVTGIVMMAVAAYFAPEIPASMFLN